ncbi:hypothetical protein ACHAWF_003605 [Thalassiosira exigua]
MGKKRNNAAKKKQAAKKKRLSSAFGVSVLKGGTIARNNGHLENPLADGSTRKQNRLLSRGEGKTKGKAPESRDEAHAPSRDTGKQSQSSNDENNEFQRLQASLEERSLASQVRKGELVMDKKARLKRQKKGWGKFARPSSTNFSPATLTLAPKSMHELVDDAADRVAQGMGEIGGGTPDASDGSALVPGQSSLSAAASLSWKKRVSDVSSQVEQSQNQNNSFAALEEDSGDENDWADRNAKSFQPLQFNPASFSFQPKVSVASVAHDSGGEDDPDL